MGLSRTSKALAATQNYTNGDIASESESVGTAWEFGGIPNQAGRGVIIDSAVLTCAVDGFTATCTLHLFSANPSASSLNDNAALDIADADALNYLGAIVFGALVDRGSSCTIAVLNIGMAAVPGDGGAKLYGLLEIVTTDTDESAGMVAQITLGFHEEA